MTGRTARVLLTIDGMAALPLSPAVGRAQAVERGPSPAATCHAPPIDSSRARRLMDQVERAAGRTPTEAGYVQLATAVRAVGVRGGCVAAVTLSHDGELGGGVVIVDAARPDAVLDVVGAYPGAREPFGAGANRVGFTYTAGRGSGVYESRVVVLCALGAQAWDECLSVTRDKRTTVFGPGMPHVEQSASVVVTGDTLVLRRTVEYDREGARPRRVVLAASRLVLPPVP